MRTFGTQGPVNPHDNYIVRRSKETADFIARVKNGKYIVIFAPRQTGKTTFSRAALATLTLKTPPISRFNLISKSSATPHLPLFTRSFPI